MVEEQIVTLRCARLKIRCCESVITLKPLWFGIKQQGQSMISAPVEHKVLPTGGKAIQAAQLISVSGSILGRNQGRRDPTPEDRLTAAATLAVGLAPRQQHLQAVPKHGCSRTSRTRLQKNLPDKERQQGLMGINRPTASCRGLESPACAGPKPPVVSY